MSGDPDKKKDHPIFVNVVSTVIAGVILLVCTTIYNLFLAHIWPVTIHFGEYSLNNFIFILVSVISSILLALIILSLEMFYLLNYLARGLLSIMIPPEKRKKRKHQWFEYILDAFLYASLGMIYVLGWFNTLLRNILRKEEKPSNPSEEAQGLLSQTLSPRTERKPELKQVSSKESQEKTL